MLVFASIYLCIFGQNLSKVYKFAQLKHRVLLFFSYFFFIFIIYSSYFSWSWSAVTRLPFGGQDGRALRSGIFVGKLPKVRKSFGGDFGSNFLG